MMKHLLNQHFKKRFITLCGCLIAFALFFSGNVFAAKKNEDKTNISQDLLLLPAEKSNSAAISLLMDVTNVNGRIVAVGERGHIIYSDSNCEEWSQADVPVSITLTAVYFPSKKDGWAVGHDGVVLHTEDGGQKWEKQIDGIKINEIMLPQLKQMIQNKTEMLENNEAGLSEEQKEALTLDLENMDFFLSDLEAAAKEGPTRPLMDLWFKNEQEGIVIGSFGTILGTTDGGKTWGSLMDRIENPNGYHYYGITRSGNDLFIAGEAGILFRSEDFGKTWKKLESPYEGSFFGIEGNPEGGFVTAFGLRGNIFYSYDRGETWSQSNIGQKASLSGSAFLSDGSFCVAGVDGSLLLSKDKGKSYTPLPTKFPGIISLTEASDGNLVVAGLRGVTRIEIKPQGGNK